jgi:peroxiredoxin
MMELGTEAPAFDLPVANPEADDISGETRSLEDYTDVEALVVVFTCNHCPYAKEVEPRLIDLAREYEPQGVAVVAICSNDAEEYPEDSFENMAKRARAKDYPFPYLRDETQQVALAYGAECTPDFFVFDGNHKLQYRGRLDDGTPSSDEVTSHDLRKALEELLETGEVTIEQVPSRGCNIKWKAKK